MTLSFVASAPTVRLLVPFVSWVPVPGFGCWCWCVQVLSYSMWLPQIAHSVLMDVPQPALSSRYVRRTRSTPLTGIPAPPANHSSPRPVPAPPCHRPDGKEKTENERQEFNRLCVCFIHHVGGAT